MFMRIFVSLDRSDRLIDCLLKKYISPGRARLQKKEKEKRIATTAVPLH